MFAAAVVNLAKGTTRANVSAMREAGRTGRQPMIDRIKHVMTVWSNHEAEEARRPDHHMTSEAPESVERAVVAEQSKITAFNRAHYAQHEPAVRADRETLAGDCVAKLRAAVDAYEQLRDFERESRLLAVECGAAPMPVLAEPTAATLAQELRDFEHRLSLRLQPRPVVTYPPLAPLVLD